MITTETILGHLKKQVEQKLPIPPSLWLEAAMKLNVLIGDEHEKLFELEQIVAQKRMESIAEGDSVAKADAKVEATDEFRLMRRQKAYIGQIEEQIRIAKAQAKLKDTEMSNY